MQAVSLRTEYLKNPVAVDISEPRLFWKCHAEGTNKIQSAYRIIARHENGKQLWDTGKSMGSETTCIPYAGEKLHSRDRVYWQAKLWDENDLEGPWSEEAYFEMGLLHESDWTARWITAPYRPNKKKRYPADYFKKSFSVTKAISKARLYLTACGLYAASINGCRAGQDCFTPGFTQYDKHMQYQTYDIKGLLKPGENDLTVALGDGWFRGNTGAYNIRNLYGKETKLLAQLELTFDDGTKETIGTDDSFSWSNDGPIRENDLKNGEIYDATRSFSFWQNARSTQYQTKLVCSNNVPVREMERFPAKLIRTPNGETVLDFSQNIAGYVEFKAPGKQGHIIILRHGEMLDQNGNFTQANFQISDKPKERVKQQITYICSSQPQVYKPSFTVMGFRYVQIENWPGDLNPEDFHAIAVYSAMEETGDFKCNNELVNQLVKNTRWSMKGNFLDVPTDCPQRERNPWTGDAQVFFETGTMLMNTAPFMRKWLRDVADAQKENGMIRSIAPCVGVNAVVKLLDGSVGWADAIVLIPYRYYNLFGDIGILKECYPSMKRYAGFMIGRTRKAGITKLLKKNPYRKFTYTAGRHWGEWAEPKEDKFEGFMALGFPRPEEATAYLFYTMSKMAKIAVILGRTQDAELYTKYADGAKSAYNYLFGKNDDIESNRPAKLVRPLALGLLDGAARKNVAKRLADLTEKRKYTIGTGFLSTPFILKTLSDNGYPVHASRMLLQEDTPGWLYQVKQGATTIWENWNISSATGHQIGSLNHYSKGSVCHWLFNTVAGIEIRQGDTTFTIQPLVAEGLTKADAVYDSIFGTVRSSWFIEGNTVTFSFTIPANTSASIHLPDGQARKVGSGEYKFNINM